MVTSAEAPELELYCGTTGLTILMTIFSYWSYDSNYNIGHGLADVPAIVGFVVIIICC